MGILKDKSSFAKNAPKGEKKGKQIVFADEKGQKIHEDVFEENLHYSPSYEANAVMDTTFEDIKRAMEERSDGGDHRVMTLLNPVIATAASTAWSWTLLHHAAYCGRVALLRPLVEMGADPNVRATDGRTPIYVACYCGRKEVAVALAALGADPTLEGDKSLCVHWKPAIDIARSEWGEDGTREILEAFDSSQVMLK